jgi:hypothetical protein
MSHWYTQGQLGVERRADLDREAAREELRSAARASGDERPGMLGRGSFSLDRLLADPVRRLARFRRRAGSVVAERPIPEPLPSATWIRR